MPFDTTPTPDLTPEAVLATFAAVDAECSHADAADIARRVNANAGDVAHAISMCEPEHAVCKLIAYQGALEEIENPAKLATRLYFEASCAKERAERFQREADEWRGKIGRDEYAAMLAAARERTAISFLKIAKTKVERADAIGVRALMAEARR